MKENLSACLGWQFVHLCCQGRGRRQDLHHVNLLLTLNKWSNIEREGKKKELNGVLFCKILGRYGKLLRNKIWDSIVDTPIFIFFVMSIGLKERGLVGGPSAE